MLQKIYEIAIQCSLYLVVTLAYLYCLSDLGVAMA
jgi:hypothetical protein